ncbi:MAG TPA: DUF4292 domain-containing protein, partial [Rubricoccaceae bacterium]|nr:DUF4292 domain-containing protein [Rubricoccaceae bacterium]
MRRAPLLVALVLLAGCSAGRRVATPPGDLPAKFPNHTPEEIVAAVGAATRGVASFSAEADVETESPNGGQGFGSSLRGRLADSLTATARGPLGIEVGRALVTRDSFFVHDKLNDRLLLGAVGVARRYVPGEVSPEMLGRALLGLLAPDPGARWTVAAEENRYVLTRADENGQPRERWLVDPTMWRAVSVEELGTDGR